MSLFVLTSKDNAWHNQIFPRYIEWWYLDVQTVSGDHISGSFAIWGNLNRPSSCVVRSDFTFTFSDGRLIDFGKQIRLADFHASTDRCYVQLGDDSFQDVGNRFLIHLERAGEAVLDVNLTPECSGFGYRYDFDPDKEQYFYWIVPVPKGTVTGRIQYGEQTISFKGVGYHDHNWASVSLSEKIQFWQWGRFLEADLALIFATVAGDQETLFQGMALIQRSVPAFEYRYLKFGPKSPTIHIEETPAGWSLSILDAGTYLEMDIVKNNLVLERGEASAYQRFLSRVSGRLSVGGAERLLSGLMVHEFKYLHRETML